jgi:hypothetical protein
MTITRRSSATATSSLRKLSAELAMLMRRRLASLKISTLRSEWCSLVTPSTNWRTVAPEALLQLFGLGGGVFQHIVQQSRDDGVDPHLQVCQDVCDGERVRDVRLPAPARLTVVAFFGEQVRLHQARGIGVGRVVPNLLDERFDLFWEFVIQRLHPTSRASHRCRAHRR